MPTASSTAVPALQSTPTLSPTATPSPTATVTPTTSPAINPYGAISRIASPDGKWTAVLDTRVGSLDLQRADGKTFAVFAPGSTADVVSWSPDSRRLLVMRTNYILPQPDSNTGALPGRPVQLWKVTIGADKPDAPSFLYQTPEPCAKCGAPAQIILGHWSPNSRSILFWEGMLSASLQDDGMDMYALDVETGSATFLAGTLVNPRYQSWSPDSSALAFTAGGDRSAQTNKWLDLYDVATGQVTTVVSKTEVIPGIVAWSPRGDWIAYAAVTAADQSDDWYSMTSNPAISKRRVYLLDPKTHEHHRLNQVDAFQDAPAWSDNGAVLYYVQRDGNDMVLMTANPSTGETQVIEGTRQPAPYAVGPYGQSNWDELLACRPDVVKAPIPQLTQTYADPTLGFALQYPTGWHVGKGFEWSYYCDDCTTFTPVANETIPSILSPFSCRVFISMEVVVRHGADMEAFLLHVRAYPGPGQSAGRAPLTLFDQRSLTIDGKPALRLETMNEPGITNHVLIVLGSQSAFILHGRGDSRVFDAIAATLTIQ